MTKKNKEIARYLLLIALTLGAYLSMNTAYELEKMSKLTTQYAGVVGIYLGVWGYIIKWFFTSTVDSQLLEKC